MLGKQELRVLDYMGRVIYTRKTIYKEYFLPKFMAIMKKENIGIKSMGSLDNFIKHKYFTIEEFVHVGFHKKLIYSYLKNLEKHNLVRSERLTDRIKHEQKKSFLKFLKGVDKEFKKEGKLPKTSFARKQYYITKKGCEIAELMSINHNPTYLKNVSEDVKLMFNL